ncbi:glyoxalase [Streptomyces albipurpureus]|uniref:Glyoxalase n=1 Tax=Streptomyces albipurpureus TaxID=2897419 RepID=A0ABT0UFJ0_9ACTN|nr:glyoxalase [Streptomyces sp. CWNU-1]MCM2387382.1 glyoxalase [Streptomyces sp. CWNU-1]
MDPSGDGPPRWGLRASEAHSTGFRGFTLALTVSGPATVDSFVGAALEVGAAVLKPAAKSLWGCGGIVQAPDGTIWKIATSAKKDTGPATREIDEAVLLLGVEDVKATEQFYVGQGPTVARSFGGKYAEFTPGQSSPVKLELYKRRSRKAEPFRLPIYMTARPSGLGRPWPARTGSIWEARTVPSRREPARRSRSSQFSVMVRVRMRPVVSGLNGP